MCRYGRTQLPCCINTASSESINDSQGTLTLKPHSDMKKQVTSELRVPGPVTTLRGKMTWRTPTVPTSSRLTRQGLCIWKPAVSSQRARAPGPSYVNAGPQCQERGTIQIPTWPSATAPQKTARFKFSLLYPSSY